MKLLIEVNIKNGSHCDGCPFMSCGHSGASTYCCLGYGYIEFKSGRYCWIRPKQCINDYKKNKILRKE